MSHFKLEQLELERFIRMLNLFFSMRPIYHAHLFMPTSQFICNLWSIYHNEKCYIINRS